MEKKYNSIGKITSISTYPIESLNNLEAVQEVILKKYNLFKEEQVDEEIQTFTIKLEMTV